MFGFHHQSKTSHQTGTFIESSAIRKMYIFPYFFFKIIDDKNIQRRITLTTFRKDMKAMVYVACVPLILSASWKHININLEEHTYNSFRTKYVETVKIQVGSFPGRRQHRYLFTPPPFTSWFCPFPFRFMRTVVYEGCTSQTGCTLTKTCPRPLKSTFLDRAKQHTAPKLAWPISRPLCLRGQEVLKAKGSN